MSIERREALRAAIEATRDGGGKVTAERVVEAARDEESVLHDEFDWNDTSAAHQQRLDAARALIRRVIIYVKPEGARPGATAIRVPEYVRSPDAAPDEQSYMRTVEALDDKELSWRIVMAEVERIRALVERARGIAAARGLSVEFEEELRLLTPKPKRRTPAPKGVEDGDRPSV